MDIKSQKGSIVIFAMLIMAIIISMAIGLVGALALRIRVSIDTIKSGVALHAADSALEWCLYVNRDKPNPPAAPTMTTPSGVIYEIKFGNSNATCAPTEAPLNHRAIGTYKNVSRSLEISE